MPLHAVARRGPESERQTLPLDRRGLSRSFGIVASVDYKSVERPLQCGRFGTVGACDCVSAFDIRPVPVLRSLGDVFCGRWPDVPEATATPGGNTGHVGRLAVR